LGTISVIAEPRKADRLKGMVDKLTEIGVDRLILLNSQRTIVSPGETRVEKLRANVIAACKQCRRSVLMEVLPLRTFNSVIEELGSQTTDHASFIAHPGLASTDSSHGTHASDGSAGKSLNLLIGPEGGFTNDEVQLARNAGIKPVSWPDTILRIETAAIVLGALMMSQRQ
jgi:16S rRNA (uracil1498-N3)-methyltransferase